MTDSNPHKCCGNLQIFWHIQFKTFAVFNLTKYPFNENIARVQNCPDITIKNLFLSFCPDITLIKCLWSLKSHSVWLSYTDKRRRRARAAKKERVPPTASVETKYLGWIRSHTIWPSSERLHLFTGPIYSGWPPDLNLKSLNRKEVAPMPGWEGDQGKKSTEKMLIWDQGNVDMGISTI